MTVKTLGINARNLIFLGRSNPRSKVKVADSKLATKRLLEKSDIATPRLLGLIENASDVFDFDWEGLPRSFAIKPNSGYGGNGIVIIFKKSEDEEGHPVWTSTDLQEWTMAALQNHILNILDGSFSLSNSPDIAIFEEKVVVPNVLRDYTYRGVPDIRIVVFNRVPVMAMLRLPTKKSHGKANVAQGAIALGIDLSTGVTTSAMTRRPWRKVIELHPDTKQELQGLEIPYWDEILRLAVESQSASQLGFAGVDLAIDKNRGPVILEINARPGLDIQVANLAPIRSRLERIQGLTVKSTAQGIRIAKELFGGDIERRVEDVSGLQVVGAFEPVEIRDMDGHLVRILAKIDTGQNLSIIDTKLAERLGLEEVTKPKSPLLKSSKRKLVRGTFFMSQEKMTSIFAVADIKSTRHPMILGRRDLKGFLVDPGKKAKS